MILKKCAFGSKRLHLPVCLRAYLLEVDSGILVAVVFFLFFFFLNKYLQAIGTPWPVFAFVSSLVTLYIKLRAKSHLKRSTLSTKSEFQSRQVPSISYWFQGLR